MFLVFMPPSPLAAQCPGQRKTGPAGALVCPGTAASWEGGSLIPQTTSALLALCILAALGIPSHASPILPGAVDAEDQTHAATRGCCQEEPTLLCRIPQHWMSTGAKLPSVAWIQRGFSMLQPSPAAKPGSGCIPTIKMRNML